MAKNTADSKKAFRELVRILDAAVQAGADCLDLEREGQDLVVYQYHGTTGIGAAPIAQEFRDAVVAEIIHRAHLLHQPTGNMLVTLQGKEYDVFVKEYDSVGGAAFTLRLNRAKRGGK